MLYTAYGVSPQRAPLQGKDLERITQPVLIIQVGPMFNDTVEPILMANKGREIAVVASEVRATTSREPGQCPTNST